MRCEFPEAARLFWRGGKSRRPVRGTPDPVMCGRSAGQKSLGLIGKSLGLIGNAPAPKYSGYGEDASVSRHGHRHFQFRAALPQCRLQLPCAANDDPHTGLAVAKGVLDRWIDSCRGDRKSQTDKGPLSPALHDRVAILIGGSIMRERAAPLALLTVPISSRAWTLWA